ncbi:MAG: DUF975 family protein [Syntrophomonadaceae bacterium]|jgi:uncharacterized membrane protein|nr:DUF975 family protein [Syntrophomonadaceae bacterium]
MIERLPLKMAAKEQISGNIGILFICFVIIFIITLGASFILFASFIIAPSFHMGLIMIFLNLTEGVKPKAENVFKGFDFFGKALWLNILIMVFVFLWSLLLIVPGIIKMISYSMSYYILADNPEMTAREALNSSKEMMHGHKKDLFVLILSFFWWFLLVGVTCGIAAIYVHPYVMATITNFYKTIKNKNDSGNAAMVQEPAFFPYETD